MMKFFFAVFGDPSEEQKREREYTRATGIEREGKVRGRGRERGRKREREREGEEKEEEREYQSILEQNSKQQTELYVINRVQLVTLNSPQNSKSIAQCRKRFH